MGVRPCQDRLEGIELVNDEVIIPITRAVFGFDEFRLINFVFENSGESRENPRELPKKRETGMKNEENINYFQML